MPRIDQLWYDLEVRTKDFESGIARSRTALTDFSAYIKANPVAVIGGLTASLLAASAALSKMAAGFEYEMRKVQVVTKGSKDELRALSDGVLQLYRTTSVGSLEELTRGLQDIVGSGIEAGKSLEFLRVSTEAAIGGATSVDVATSALLTLQANYAKTGLSVEAISDKLFRAVDVGRMSFEELASTIGKVAPLTAQYDISLDDLLGTLAQLTVNGLSTAESVTAIRSAIVNIINPTGKLAKEMPALAKAFDADRLRKDGFAKFLVDFKKAADESGVEIQSLLGDVQGLIGSLSLLGDGGVGAKEKIEALANSTGATKDAFNEMSSSAKALNDEALNALKATMLDMGTSLLPWWNNILMKVISLIDDKRAAVLRLKKSIAELRDINGAQVDPGQFNLARRMVDPTQGGTANFFRGMGGTSFGGLQAGLIAGEALLRDPNGLGRIDEKAKALAELLARFQKVGREAFDGMSLPEMETLAEQLDILRAKLPKGDDANDVGSLARNLRATAAATKEAADEAARLGNYFGGAATPGAPAGGKGNGKPETAEERKKRLADLAKTAESLAELQSQVAGMMAGFEAQQSGGDPLAGLTVRLAELRREAGKLKLGEDAALAFGASLDAVMDAAKAKQAEDLAAKLRDLTAAMTLTVADDLANEIADLERQFAGATGATREQADAFLQLKREARDAAVGAEQLAHHLEELRELNAGGARTDMATMGELLSMRDAAEADRAKADSAEKLAAAKARIRALDEEIARLQEKTTDDAKDANDAADELETKTQRVAGAVEKAANFAFGLATAFKGAGSEAAQLFGSIGQIAGGIGDLSGLAKKAGGFKELFSSGAGITSALGPMGAMFGGAMAIGNMLFPKEDPEAARRREANTKALNDLTNAVGDLDLGSTGKNRDTAVRIAADALAQNPGGGVMGSLDRNAQVEKALREAGMSVEEFKRQASLLGIEIDKVGNITKDEFEKIVAAAGTLGVHLQDLREGFGVLGTGAMEKLRSMLTLLAAEGDEASKSLASQVAGYDLATEAGRTAAEAAIRAGYELKQISPALAKELLAMIGDVTEAARSARAKAVGDVKDDLAFRDVDDPGEQLTALAAAYGEQIPVLASLRQGLDLTTKEGLAEFDRRLLAFRDGVKDGSVALDGFSADEVISALYAMESASDAAAAGIAAAAGEVRRLFEDLDVRELRALGDVDGADLLDTKKKGDADIASAKALLEKGLITQEDFDRLARVVGLEFQNVADRISGRDDERAGGGRSKDAETSVLARAGAQSIDLLIGIGNSGLALDRERNAILAALARAMQVGPMPHLMPPLSAAIFGGASGGQTYGSGGGMSAGIVVQQTVAFYGTVYGVEEVQAGIRRSGSDVAAELQRRVDNQQRVEGRPEAR